MRTIIDCDATFDVLTRGPFPGGHESDDAVATHLESCHNCRALAEALRPAVDLFHESLNDAERTSLPQYVVPVRNTKSLERRILTVVESVALKPSPQDLWFDSRRWVHYVLAPLILIVLISLVLRGFSEISGSQKSVALAADPVNGMTLLAALSIPASCVVDSPGDAMIAAKDPFVCCTQCHALANPDRPAIRCIAQLTVACIACHMATQTATGCCHDCHDVDSPVADAPIVDHGPIHADGSVTSAEQRLSVACGACHENARSS